MNTFDEFLIPHLTNINVVENRLSTDLTLPKIFPYFDGHFPTDPIMPGIIGLEISVWLAKKFLSVPFELVLKQAQDSKFLDVIRPGEHILIELSFDKGTRQLLANWSRAGTPIIKIRACLA